MHPILVSVDINTKGPGWNGATISEARTLNGIIIYKRVFCDSHAVQTPT